jgi:hypothetical protein
MTGGATDVHVDQFVKARWLAIGLSQADLAEVLGGTFQQAAEDGNGSNCVDRRSIGDTGRLLLRPDRWRRTESTRSFVGAAHRYPAIGARVAPAAGFSGYDGSTNQRGADSSGRSSNVRPTGAATAVSELQSSNGVARR